MAKGTESGIYGIFNLVNNKVYIGCTGSTVGFRNRFTCHRSELRLNKHHNKHLQRAWNRYGADSFEFKAVEKCIDDVLLNREDTWMEYYDSINNGYNMESGTRKTLSEETKIKISKAGMGRVCSKETRKRISKSNMGKSQSQETRDKISKGRMGKKHTEETKKKISPLGRKHTEETKKKMSISAKGKNTWTKGRNQSEEEKEKHSIAMCGKKNAKGYKYTQEQSKRRSEQMKKNWAKRKLKGVS